MVVIAEQAVWVATAYGTALLMPPFHCCGPETLLAERLKRSPGSGCVPSFKDFLPGVIGHKPP